MYKFIVAVILMSSCVEVPSSSLAKSRGNRCNANPHLEVHQLDVAPGTLGVEDRYNFISPMYVCTNGLWVPVTIQEMGGRPNE